MRRIVVRLAVVAMLIGVSVVSALPAGARTIDAQCDLFGKMVISPGLTPAAQTETFKLSGDVEGDTGSAPCPGSIGNFQGTLKSPSAYCDGGQIVGDAAVGKLTITWNDAVTSTVRLHMADDPNANYGKSLVSGKVVDGRYLGDHVGGSFTLIQRNGDCGISTITEADFETGNDRGPHPLTFSHP